ncbi:hypothetical protein CGGC5_v002464 [Colletotrichum fructicola Nara gc5]|uniref:Heterokaryon incompatibility domain-containing protein n=1 Tax=Colletotrichum fructicola (strain Nara gc5) TaxID=1213859 RepID=A0A7J6JMC9_COLFN|nr:hypothetical protein CGGC5_v002464 [Colletotrichum fructicola Nara gc5]
MAESARAGCRMCGFIRERLLQRNIGYKGEIFVNGAYLWGGQGDANDVSVTDPGLAYWRCEAYKVEGGTRSAQLAVLNFDIETSNNDLLQWLRVDAKCAPEPLDADTVEWLKSELRSCDNECDHVKPASHFLPTRLIDVGQSEMDVPRLIFTKDAFNLGTIDDLEYAALSYCWGPKRDALKQVKTTKSTIAAHCQGMPLSSLSPVVRDTVKVCWALGIRYLWVDALCIIQGDKEDWDQESQMMGHVYYSCSVAICPVSSESCLEGYLGTRPRGIDVPFESSRRKHIKGSYRLIISSTDLDEVAMGAPRPGPSLYVDLQRSSWDRRGLSGLAQGFATITGDTYLAGLWKNDLHHQLVWEISRPLAGDLASLVHSLQHADPYIAPSWSWASRRARYENLPDRQFSMSVAAQEATSAADEKEKTFFEVVTQPSHVRPEFALIDYRIDLQGSNTFGSVSGAFLRLRGKMCAFPSDVGREALGPSGDCRPSYGKFSGGIGTCMLDWGVSETSVQGPESMQLFLICSCCSPTSQWGKMKWLADCDDEDYDDWVPSDAELGDSSFASSYESIDTCKYCADPMHRRTGWGLVIHPMEELGNYARVGAFVLFAHKGGMDLFKSEPEEIILV